LLKSRLIIFKQYLWLALLVVLARVVFRLVFDKFSFDNFVVSAVDGLKLATWVLGFGLINALVDFRKLLPKSPRFLKTITTALNISLSVTPEIVRSIDRVKAAANLRAHRRGIHLIRSLVVPVVSNAIDQAINLGDSMSSRGFGSSRFQEKKSGALELRDITFAYQGANPVLKNVSLSIPSGSLTVLSGNTGSGKSTLLKVIQGRHPGCAYVNQFPRDGFVADKVFDELAFALIQRSVSRPEITSRVTEIAHVFELQDFLYTNPHELSAGFQQRLAIAAALIANDKVLLLDEPFSALDEPSSRSLLNTLETLKNLGVTIVIAEHRVELLNKLADLKFTVEIGGLTCGQPTTRKLVREETSAGSITALFGPNGSGKTTHLRKLASERGVLVPQPASDLLFLNTVGEELAMADLDSKSEKGTAAGIFQSLVGEVALIQNPRDLSQGQKLALAISIQLSKTTNLLMLDEPTLGFDFDAKASLVNHLRGLSESGVEIIVATHDLEFAKAIATKTEYLQGGVVNNV
jgi:energy-coupling factor transport system ATP-binding protein